MKTIRSYIVFLFVFLISVSIFFDWNTEMFHHFNISISEKQLFDAQEDVCSCKSSTGKQFKSAQYNKVDFSKEFFATSISLIKNHSDLLFYKINTYTCRVKLYLHLLHLF